MLGLVVCSLVTLGGATRDDVARPAALLRRPPGCLPVVGLVLMLALSRLDYSRLRELKYATLRRCMIALDPAVLALGTAARGSQRAIDLPFFSFQPSELGKVLLIARAVGASSSTAAPAARRDTTARVMLLGAGARDARDRPARPRLGLVYVVDRARRCCSSPARPGGTSRRSARSVAVAIDARARRRAGGRRARAQALPGGAPDGVPAPDDQRPAEEGYQQQQSKIAIGSGEKTGRGVRTRRRRKLNFLPEHHTDFIFAVVGEKYGFVGAALVLSLYALLIWRALRILTMAKNLFGSLIAGGVVGDADVPGLRQRRA